MDMQSLVNENKVLRPAPHVVSRQIDEEMVLINLENEKMFTLNSTGTRFWQLLEQGIRITEIIHHMQQEYDVDSQDLEQEIETLLTDLLEEELIIGD